VYYFQLLNPGLFQLRKAKEKSSGVLRKFRECGTTPKPKLT